MGATASQDDQSQLRAEADAFFANPQLLRACNKGEQMMVLPQACRQRIEEVVQREFGDRRTFMAGAVKPLPVVTGRFDDPEFPPTKASLIRFWSTADIMTQSTWANYSWKRLSEAFPDRKLAVFDTIHPNDIQQGALGDCYFLSALSALAERPERVKRLFITKDIPANCCYQLSIFNLGMWSNFAVDDYVPVVKYEDGSERLAFSGPREEKGVVELWTVLLEKAWAKKYHSYYEIQSGYNSEVLTDLTGAPCETLETSSPLLWEKLVVADQRDFIMTASSFQDVSHTYRDLGLVADHSYSIISVRELPSGVGTTAKVLKVRNPWGRFEWKGDWSDRSAKWTPEAKAAAQFVEESDDGVFWISVEDFRKYFEVATICYVHDQFWSCNLPMDQRKEEEFSVVEVKVTTKTLLYFMVCQLDERHFGGLEGGYQYAPVRLILSRQTSPNSLEYITGKTCAYTRDSWLQAELNPGTYLMYVELNWRNDLTDLFGVSVYCAEQVQLKDVSSDYPEYLQICFNQSLLQRIAPSRKSESLSYTYCSVKLAGEKDNGENMEGIYVDVFTNKSQDSPLILSVKHEPWTNMKLCRPFQHHIRGNFELELRPGESKAIVKKQVSLLEPHSFKVLVKKLATRGN